MGFTTRPEAYAMDINTVNLWLTNAKHQPTSSVEIEGTPATRQASITEFFTSVATSAAFQVGSRLVSDGLGSLADMNNTDVAIMQANGASPVVVGAANAFVKTKEFIADVTANAKSIASDIATPVVEKFELGASTFKESFVNPLNNKYTQWIVDAGSAATDYAAKASSLSAYPAQQLALNAAQQYTNDTTLPSFQSAKDSSNSLVTGSFTVEDAAKYGSSNTASLMAFSSEEQPYQDQTTNDVLRGLGYAEQPTFDQLAGILSKDYLHDDLEAALAAEALAREEDLTDTAKFEAWQESFANLQSCIEAVQQEVTDNQYNITVVVAQENALRSVARIQSVRAGITDPAILATYDKCLKNSTKDAVDATNFFIDNQNI